MKNGLIKLLTLLAIIVFTAFSLKVAPVSYEVDTNSTKIKWTGYHIAKSYSHYGHINAKSGELEIEDGNLKGGELIIDMTSIANDDLDDQAKNKKLVGHLKSEDFFYVEKYPEAALKIKNVVNAADGSYNVTGDLTIRGLTQEISFPVTKGKSGKNTVSFSAKLSIDRTKHEVLYGWSAENVIISDEFDLEIEIVANNPVN